MNTNFEHFLFFIIMFFTFLNSGTIFNIILNLFKYKKYQLYFKKDKNLLNLYLNKNYKINIFIYNFKNIFKKHLSMLTPDFFYVTYLIFFLFIFILYIFTDKFIQVDSSYLIIYNNSNINQFILYKFCSL